MIEIVLILEDDNNKYHNIFYSSNDLEDFLKQINLNKYVYKNIIFRIDDDINIPMSNIYQKKYLA
jgi:hypothetical protein